MPSRARLHDEISPKAIRFVRLWLIIVTLLVLAMVVVGGATRLSGSGLSITEWDPIMGAIPPLATGDWDAAFAKYRQIPQYRHLNAGMTLAEFRQIYWWEWSHRLLGRLVGVVFIVPLVVFAVWGWISRGLALRFTLIAVLGALQGFIGWFMVQSGLDSSSGDFVSPYRLALHLTGAALIFAVLVRAVLELRPRWTSAVSAPPHRPLAGALVLLVFFQIVLGAFVAGSHAGLIYTTWPSMNGAVVPPDLFDLEPWYANFTENLATIQFDHRWVAYLIVALALLRSVLVRREDASAEVRRAADFVALAALVQSGFGVLTLLLAARGSIPLHPALTHQAVAFVLLGLAIRAYRLTSASRAEFVAPARARASV